MHTFPFSKSSPTFLILCLFTLFFTNSCKTKQAARTPQVEQTPAKTPVKAAYKIQQPDYQWFSTRMDARVINTDNQKEIVKLAVFMVNKKDSILYINASKLGIEFARLVLTPDSIKYINHLNSTYFIGDYSAAYHLFGLPLSYNMLQALLMNSDFADFENDFNVITKNDTSYLIDSNRRQNNARFSINQRIVLNENDRIIENHIIHTFTSDTLTAQYSDFFNVTTLYRSPKIIDISLQRQNIRLILTLKEPKINVPGPTYFKIPLKYTLIEIK